ncbi:MAG: hypothetical protein ACUZ8I_02230 [Candidatus Scalindua sp.]
MNDNTKIAGTKSVKDWKILRNKLRDNLDNSLWLEAYGFFENRLNTRYFNPIDAIKTQDKFIGEGFSITAILCSLIEFLETTWTGEKYRFCADNELGDYEYNRSKLKFISFLENRPPFSNVFSNKDGLALQFYENVRCGLLHEASTKLNWIIRTDNNSEFYEFRNGEHVIDRNLFEIKIKEFLKYYRTQLLENVFLQNAFIRKMNSIAGLELNF